MMTVRVYNGRYAMGKIHFAPNDTGLLRALHSRNPHKHPDAIAQGRAFGIVDGRKK